MPRTPALVALLLLSVLPSAHAQRRHLLTEFGAGYYQGGSSFKGPIQYARLVASFGSRLLIGPRVEYRDDDFAGGRGQALGLGLEAAINGPLEWEGGAALYFPIALGVEYGWRSHLPNAGRADGTDGLGVRASVGAGVGIPIGPTQLDVEVLEALSPHASYTSATISMRSRPNALEDVAGSVVLFTGQLHPVGPEYARWPGAQGYGLGWRFPVTDLPGVRDLRATLGTDVLQYQLRRIDAAYVFLGPAIDFVRLGNVLLVQGVPQVGAMFGTGLFRGNVAGQVSLEATLGWKRLGVYGALGQVLARGAGPGGFVALRQNRIGISVRL